jgi:hypothetical protein
LSIFSPSLSSPSCFSFTLPPQWTRTLSAAPCPESACSCS